MKKAPKVILCPVCKKYQHYSFNSKRMTLICNGCGVRHRARIEMGLPVVDSSPAPPVPEPERPIIPTRGYQYSQENRGQSSRCVYEGALHYFWVMRDRFEGTYLPAPIPESCKKGWPRGDFVYIVLTLIEQQGCITVEDLYPYVSDQTRWNILRRLYQLADKGVINATLNGDIVPRPKKSRTALAVVFFIDIDRLYDPDLPSRTRPRPEPLNTKPDNIPNRCQAWMSWGFSSSEGFHAPPHLHE